MNVTFTERDFQTFRNFENRMAKEFGKSTYTGTDNFVMPVEYSPELKAMIRPLPPATHFEFTVKVLGCVDCKTNCVYFCLPTQNDYVCDNCREKRKKKGVKKEVAV